MWISGASENIAGDFIPKNRGEFILTRQVTEILFELSDMDGIIADTYHVKDQKHVEEKFTIEPKEPIATERKPTGQKQEAKVERKPQVQPSKGIKAEKP